MILKMEKLILYALSENKTEILDKLMDLQCVQMISPEQTADYESLSAATSRDIPAAYEFESKLSEISSALGVLLEYEPKAKLFSKKEELPLKQILNLDTVEEALKTVSSVRGIVSNIAEVKSFQSADLFTKQSLLPWKTLDLPLQDFQTRYATVQLYTVPSEVSMDALREEAAQLDCALEEVSSDAELHYVAVAVLAGRNDEVKALFKEKNALLVTPPALRGTPSTIIAALEQKNEEYEENHKVLLETLQKMASQTAGLKKAYDQLSTAVAHQKARQNLLLTGETFFVTGWVTQKDKTKVDKALESFSCCYEYVLPAKGEMPPIKLKNNVLVEPFEVITEMYGLPHPATLDPDPLIAPFFFLFFGMMLSDAGYGLLLLVGGFLAAKMARKGSFGNKMFRLIGLCGISTIIWGALYGSWFGDVVTSVAKTFFGATVTVPALINPLEEPMTIMIMSFIFGAVHLFVGMGVKAYMLIRAGDVKSAIFDIGFWYMVLIGLGMLLLGGAFASIGTWLAILGAVGLVLTQGRHKPNLMGKITSGVLSLYDITGYFSDVLSYSRILALGLATGVIATVVNILATLPGANLIGVLLFVIIFVFGHLLNLAINALGAYVHTSRLQYVEFFGKFYEGGGKPFVPFAPDTKYNLVHSNSNSEEEM